MPLLQFVLHWFNWLLVAAWVQQRQGGKDWRLPMAMAGLLLFLVVGYGAWRLADVDRLQQAPTTPRIDLGILVKEDGSSLSC